ncbi:MAG: hypothetical protein IT319_01620 [Anaerolineae bacterium]|nr:hypothetical protein [Anaerolineae bacterium]
MAHQAALLYQLQQVDQEIVQHRNRLKEIEALLSGDETIAQATRQLETAQAELKPAQAHARELDLEIRSVMDKAKAADADLYGGRIRSPKALQELQEEIDSLKRRQSQLEDNLLETMMQVEESEAQVAGAQQALADARAALASRQTELVDEQQRRQAGLAEAEQERAAMAAGIEPASLAAYEKLRPRFRGQVIALLKPDGCSICGVEQTSVNAQNVRLGRTLAYCESCGRILAYTS